MRDFSSSILLLVTVLLSTAYCSLVTPLGYWPLTKEYQFNDVSVNVLNGEATSSNVVSVLGPLGVDDTAFKLGADDNSFIKIVNSKLSLGANSWTIGMYVKNVAGTKAPIIEYLNGMGIRFYDDDPSILYVKARSFSDDLTVTCTSADTDWRYIAVSYDNSTKKIRLFCDEVVSQDFNCNTPVLTSDTVYIGKVDASMLDINAGRYLDGYVAGLSFHLEAMTDITQLKNAFSRFSISCSYNPDDYSVTLPAFVDAKGHFPLSVVASSCFNTSRIHVCKFTDTFSGQQTSVIGTVNIARTSVACTVPYLYTAGRVKVEVAAIDKADLDNATLAFEQAVSTWKYVTVGLEASKVNALLVSNTGDSATFNMTWSSSWFSEQLSSLFPAGSENSANYGIGDFVDVSLMWFNRTSNQWQLYTSVKAISNSGFYQFKAITTNIAEEVALSFYTFRISLSVNWTYVAAGIESDIQTTDFKDLVAKYPKLNDLASSLSTSNDNFEDQCFELWFMPIATFLGACKYATLGQFSNELAPLASTDISNAACSNYLSQFTASSDVINCPAASYQAMADARFVQNVPYVSSISVSLSSSISMPSVTIDTNGHSRLAEYSQTTGLSKTSALVKGMCWSLDNGGAANSIYDLMNEGILPWLYCCSSNPDGQLCQSYKDVKSHKPCSNYDVPGNSWGSGDPHFTTLDGYYYTFNAHGEFWVMKSTSSEVNRQFSVQGRITPTGLVSWFTAFAIQAAPNSAVVQVEASGSSLVVKVDGYQLDFSDSRVKTQCFPGAVVTLNSASSVTVTLVADVAFTISISGGYLSIIVAAGPSLKGKVTALMGNFDGDQTNDLTTPAGNVIAITSSEQTIHDNFGMLWLVDAADSLFTYPNGKTYADYYDATFVPFYWPSGQAYSQNAIDICGADNKACLYDYDNTNDAALANQTLNVQTEVQGIEDILTTTITTCPDVTRPDNGFMETPDGFNVNAIVTFGCFENYWLNGAPNATCNTDGTWNNAKPECRLLYCPDVDVPDNLIVPTTLNRTLYNTNITVFCEDGYNVTGNSFIMCQYDSTWSSDLPTCTQITCPTLTAQAHSVMTLSTTESVYGTVATFQCESEFYYLEGQAKLTCGLTGSWDSAVTPSCLALCPTVQYNQATISATLPATAKIGTTASFSCVKAEQTLIGSSTIVCGTNSLWNDTAPYCCNSAASLLPAVYAIVLAFIAIYVF